MPGVSRLDLALVDKPHTEIDKHDGCDWPTQPNEAYSLNKQVTRINEDGSVFSTRLVETQLFKSKNVFGADAMDI